MTPRRLAFWFLMAAVIGAFGCAQRYVRTGQHYLIQWPKTRDLVRMGEPLGDGWWECWSVNGPPIAQGCNLRSAEWLVHVRPQAPASHERVSR